jgi:hypothetical protein
MPFLMTAVASSMTPRCPTRPNRSPPGCSWDNFWITWCWTIRRSFVPMRRMGTRQCSGARAAALGATSPHPARHAFRGRLARPGGFGQCHRHWPLAWRLALAVSRRAVFMRTPTKPEPTGSPYPVSRRLSHDLARASTAMLASAWGR